MVSQREQRLKTPLQRFHEKYEKVEGGCWEWKSRSEYPKFAISSYVKVKASHFMMEEAGNPRPDGYHCCHSCDNPRCVNPDHLFWGTHQDNMQDKSAKGRSKAGGAAKVTAEVAQEIRERYAAGGISQSSLAKEYGITQGAVSFITLKKVWK